MALHQYYHYLLPQMNLLKRDNSASILPYCIHYQATPQFFVMQQSTFSAKDGMNSSSSVLLIFVPSFMMHTV